MNVARRFEYLISDQRFICHAAKNDWGGSILMVEKSGKGFARTYWFSDDENTIYFDMLSVSEPERKNGLGNEILSTHLKLAESLKIESMLWVYVNTWMYEWYKRKGYNNYKPYEKDSNAVWMRISFNQHR